MSITWLFSSRPFRFSRLGLAFSAALTLCWGGAHLSFSSEDQYQWPALCEQVHTGAAAWRYTPAPETTYTITREDHEAEHLARGALEIACLEDLITQGALTHSVPTEHSAWAYQGPVFEQFERIKKLKNLHPYLKARAAIVLADGLARHRMPRGEDVLETLAYAFLRPLGNCSDSAALCDLLLEFIASSARVNPRLAQALLGEERIALERWPEELLIREMYALRMRGLTLFARFYENTQIAQDGQTPRWHGETRQSPPLTRAAFQTELDAALEDFDSFSAVWFNPEDVRSVVLSELLQCTSENTLCLNDSDSIPALAQALSHSLLAQSTGLAALRIYVDRLELVDPASWFQNTLHPRHAQENPALRGVVLQLFHLFSDTEAFLPSRREWLKLMREWHQSHPELGLEARVGFTESLVTQSVLIEQKLLHELGMEDLHIYEKKLAARDPGFGSWQAQVATITTHLSRMLQHLEEFIKSSDTSETTRKRLLGAKDFEVLQVETLLLRFKCIASEGGAPFRITLPQSRLEFESKHCGPRDARASEIQDRVNAWYISTLKRREIAVNVVLPFAEGAITAVSAVASGGLSIVAAGALKTTGQWALKKAAMSAARAEATQQSTRFLIRRAAAGFGSLVLNASLFTLAQKSLHAALVQAPGINDLGLPGFWDSQLGVWENLGDPILTGTVIFAVLPFTHPVKNWLSARLSAGIRANAGSTSEALAGYSSHLFVDTAAFTSIGAVDHGVRHALQEWSATEDSPAIPGPDPLSTDAIAHSAYIAAIFNSTAVMSPLETANRRALLVLARSRFGIKIGLR